MLDVERCCLSSQVSARCDGARLSRRRPNTRLPWEVLNEALALLCRTVQLQLYLLKCFSLDPRVFSLSPL